jgi:CheY-like chemotaxis protein
LLWVDSNVDGNTDIRKILKLWGVSVDCAKSDDEAYQYLRNSSIDNGYYSLIITNNHHIEGSGVNFSDNVRRDFPELDIPVILFSSSYGGDSIRIHGVPKNIFAATNRYDYLFHFIFDVLERGNAPYPANIERYLQDT